MLINASMKMTTTALMVALSRANAANSVKYLGQKRKFRFEMPRHDLRSQWREAALFRRLTLSGLRFHSEAFLFHHRPADPKSVEPTHCQVGLPLALQARQGLLIGAHRSYAHWKPRIEPSDQRERQVHATLFTFAEDQSEFSAYPLCQQVGRQRSIPLRRR